jgi:NTE family protein
VTEILAGGTRVGLALSGGGARGFAHVGTLRVLERHDVPVDVIAGTSMGAVIGAFAAAGYGSDDIHAVIRSISWRDVADLSLQAGIFKGDRLAALLADLLPPRFEDLERPLAVTCTDLEHGQSVVITGGDLISAVRASASFPGAFEPVVIDGRALADGGICNNLPVDVLALMRASVTIASDVTPSRRAAYPRPHDDHRPWWERVVATMKLERRTTMAAVTLRAADVMMRILTDAQYVHHPADLRIQHELPAHRLESFREFERIIELGEENAEAAVAEARDLVQGLARARR